MSNIIIIAEEIKDIKTLKSPAMQAITKKITQVQNWAVFVTTLSILVNHQFYQKVEGAYLYLWALAKW